MCDKSCLSNLLTYIMKVYMHKKLNTQYLTSEKLNTQFCITIFLFVSLNNALGAAFSKRKGQKCIKKVRKS